MTESGSIMVLVIRGPGRTERLGLWCDAENLASEWSSCGGYQSHGSTGLKWEGGRDLSEYTHGLLEPTSVDLTK